MHTNSKKTKFQLSFRGHPAFETLLKDIDALPTELSLDGVNYTLESHGVTMTEASWNVMHGGSDGFELEVSTSSLLKVACHGAVSM